MAAKAKRMNDAEMLGQVRRETMRLVMEQRRDIKRFRAWYNGERKLLPVVTADTGARAWLSLTPRQLLWEITGGDVEGYDTPEDIPPRRVSRVLWGLRKRGLSFQVGKNRYRLRRWN